MSYAQTLETYRSLRPGDRIAWTHELKIGFRSWTQTAAGVVVRTERGRHGLHYRRNFDDKVFSDTIVVRRDDGELTTIALDEFSELQRLSAVNAGA